MNWVLSGKQPLFLILVSSSMLLYISITSMTALSSNKVNETVSLIRMFTANLDGFYLDVGRYPSTQEGLQALYEKPPQVSSKKWQGPYFLHKERLLDPWWQEFRYLSPGLHNQDTFDLFSLGQDGLADTADDINNWDDQQLWRKVYSLHAWSWNDLTKGWYWWDWWETYKWKIAAFLLILLISILVEVIRAYWRTQKSRR